MEKIPAKERFSRHERSHSTPLEVLNRAAREFGFFPETSRIRQLSGGFMNANYCVTDDQKRAVLRVYSTNRRTAETEFDILAFLADHPVLAPRPYKLTDIEGHSIVMMEYLDGITLEDKILSGDQIDLNLYTEIGHQLGQIHSIHFKDAGFMGPKVTVGKEFEDFGVFLRQFIERTLNQLKANEERLALKTNERFQRLIQERWPLVLKRGPVRELVHADFNPKNILVTRDSPTKLMGIIDWEFCFAGDGLIDVGNFFRFSYDYPAEARDRFWAGYRSANSGLPPQWEEIAALLDLGNMCSFLERKEDYQESFRTARAVINSTLERFGY